MITTRDDYDYVEIDDGLVINGGILPVRDNGGSGIDGPEVIRAEDNAFALEAAHERARVAGTTRPSYTFVDKSIVGARWQSAISALHASADRACKTGTSAPYSKDISDAVPYGAKLSDIYPELYFDPSTLVSDVVKFGSGEGFSQEPIRDVYRDIRRLTMYEVSGNPHRTSDEYTQTHGGGPRHNPIAVASGFRVFAHEAINYGQESLVDLNGWSQAIADVGSVGLTQHYRDLTHVGRYQLVVELAVYIYSEDLISGQESNSTYHTIVVIDGSGNSLECDMSALGIAARDAAIRFYGGPLPTTLPDGKIFNLTVSFSNSTNHKAAVYLDDHTDFSHVPFPDVG